MALNPHLQLPFTLKRQGSRRAAAVVEQDTDDHILQCVEAILSYEQGSREEAMDFGIPDLSFALFGADVEDIRAAVSAQEPRAELIFDEDTSQLAELIERVRIYLNRRTDA